MKKELDLTKTVAELVEEFPEFQQAMADIGFEEIMNPEVLNLMGRVMTLPKGVAVKGMKLDDVVRQLEERGFTVKDSKAEPSACACSGDAHGAAHAHAHGGCGCHGAAGASATGADGESGERAAVLKGLLRRLSDGESLDTVRADFVKDFASVSAEEISAAEQELIDGGMAIHEVQKLCDVHSALFHGHIGGALPAEGTPPEVKDLPEGHPLRILVAENEGLAALLEEMKTALAQGDATAFGAGLGQLNGLYAHYGKKESLLMPLLYRNGVTGPSGVMWGVDDEIKQEMRSLAKETADGLAGQEERIAAFLQRISDMIYKEEQILFPLTLRFFTERDWLMVYRDMEEIGFAFLREVPRWSAGEAYVVEAKEKERAALAGGSVRLSTGALSFKALEAILNLLPVDLTFIDKDDILRFFSNPGQVFVRPRLALGGNVQDCHPASVLPVIEQLIADFKAKRRDHMEIYRYIKGKPVGVRYLAVYDDAGEYIGTVEVVEDFERALEAFSGKQQAGGAMPQG